MRYTKMMYNEFNYTCIQVQVHYIIYAGSPKPIYVRFLFPPIQNQITTNYIYEYNIQVYICILYRKKKSKTKRIRDKPKIFIFYIIIYYIYKYINERREQNVVKERKKLFNLYPLLYYNAKIIYNNVDNVMEHILISQYFIKYYK